MEGINGATRRRNFVPTDNSLLAIVDGSFLFQLLQLSLR